MLSKFSILLGCVCTAYTLWGVVQSFNNSRRERSKITLYQRVPTIAISQKLSKSFELPAPHHILHHHSIERTVLALPIHTFGCPCHSYTQRIRTHPTTITKTMKWKCGKWHFINISQLHNLNANV